MNLPHTGSGVLRSRARQCGDAPTARRRSALGVDRDVFVVVSDGARASEERATCVSRFSRSRTASVRGPEGESAAEWSLARDAGASGFRTAVAAFER